MSERTYTVRLGGEGGTTYRVEGWSGMTEARTCAVLSTVTGFRPYYLRRALVRGIRQSPRGVWELRPTACAWDAAARFLITDDLRST